MKKQEALDIIDRHKNSLINPVEMLGWVWLRVIILQIKEEQWESLVADATKVLAAD